MRVPKTVRMVGVYLKGANLRNPASQYISRTMASLAYGEGFALWVNRNRDIQLTHHSFPIRGASCTMSERVLLLILGGSEEHRAIIYPPPAIRPYRPAPVSDYTARRVARKDSRIIYSV